jgi:hypothetical protein
VGELAIEWLFETASLVPKYCACSFCGNSTSAIIFKNLNKLLSELQLFIGHFLQAVENYFILND